MNKIVLLVAIVFLLAGLALTQEHAAEPAKAPATQTEPHRPSTDERGTNKQLAEASNEAAHHGETEAEENAEFKESPSVKFISKMTGLSLKGAYWLAVALNFLIIAALVVWGLKANLPAAFRARTQTIHKTMAEARTASEDANRRLTDIESRLAKLDSEIASMRASAEAEGDAEEERIRQAAEHDRQRIVDAAHAEIESASRIAQRELKAYAAELAVSLAAKRIQVDANTDRALVQSFTRELAGKDGR